MGRLDVILDWRLTAQVEAVVLSVLRAGAPTVARVSLMWLDQNKACKPDFVPDRVLNRELCKRKLTRDELEI